MGWKHYQTVDYPKWEPQVGRGLFGIRLLILHFKFQFSKSIKSSTFHISLNLTYPLRKNISFPKCPKITQKFTQNRQTEANEMSRDILASLETWPRYWQKGRVKRRQNSLHVYRVIGLFTQVSYCLLLKGRQLWEYADNGDHKYQEISELIWLALTPFGSDGLPFARQKYWAYM